MRASRAWVLPTVTLLLVAVVWLSSESEQVKFLLHSHGQLHPWLHLLGFAALGCFAVCSSNRAWVRLVLLAVIASLAWGTEFREHLLDGWPVEQADVRLNYLGLALGSAVSWLAGLVSKAPMPSS